MNGQQIGAVAGNRVGAQPHFTAGQCTPQSDGGRAQINPAGARERRLCRDGVQHHTAHATQRETCPASLLMLRRIHSWIVWSTPAVVVRKINSRMLESRPLIKSIGKHAPACCRSRTLAENQLQDFKP